MSGIVHGLNYHYFTYYSNKYGWNKEYWFWYYHILVWTWIGSQCKQFKVFRRVPSNKLWVEDCLEINYRGVRLYGNVWDIDSVLLYVRFVAEIEETMINKCRTSWNTFIFLNWTNIETFVLGTHYLKNWHIQNPFLSNLEFGSMKTMWFVFRLIESAQWVTQIVGICFSFGRTKPKKVVSLSSKNKSKISK